LTGAKGSYEYSYDHDFPFFLSEPNCNGNEEHLIDCPGSEIENITYCFWTSVVYCADADPCNDTGIIRLSPVTSDNNDTFGRLEICYNGYWGSTCDYYQGSATRITANVACQQLGYERGLLYSHQQFDVTLPNIPILLSNIWCTGNETSLLECSQTFSYRDCNHRDDIILECVGKKSTNFM
jgi:hypothetical protein